MIPVRLSHLSLPKHLTEEGRLLVVYKIFGFFPSEIDFVTGTSTCTEEYGKNKKELTKEEKLAKDRERKKLKYAETKSNPELYRIFQENEKQRYLLKKERKSGVGIKDMCEWAKRDQRYKWRKNSLTYLKKIKNLHQILLENSPPKIENEEIQEPRIIQDDPLATSSSDPVQKAEPVDKNSTSKNEHDEKLIKAIRRFRYNHVLNELKKNINILEKENEKLRRNHKQQQIQKSKEDKLEKKVNEIMIKDIRQDKVRVQKKIIVLRNNHKTTEKDKRSLAESILMSKGKLLKYCIVSKLTFSLKEKKQAECDQGKKEAQMKLQVQHVFEEDVNNSQVAAEKKQCIKRNGIRKQKRYLTDYLRNLHVKYYKQVAFIGYSTFCRYRPFWAVHPGNKRDTCQCKLHANTKPKYSAKVQLLIFCQTFAVTYKTQHVYKDHAIVVTKTSYTITNLTTAKM